MTTSDRADGLDMRTAGPLPPDAEVVALICRYLAVSFGDSSIADRDHQRRPLLAEGWIYHGIDGSPIGFEGLTQRQTRNELRVDERHTHDHTLFQHENTAVFTFKVWTRGEDKGRSFEGCGSWATVITRTEEGWRVAADVVGAEPNEHYEPADAVSWK